MINVYSGYNYFEGTNFRTHIVESHSQINVQIIMVIIILSIKGERQSCNNCNTKASTEVHYTHRALYVMLKVCVNQHKMNTN